MFYTRARVCVCVCCKFTHCHYLFSTNRVQTLLRERPYPHFIRCNAPKGISSHTIKWQLLFPQDGRSQSMLSPTFIGWTATKDHWKRWNPKSQAFQNLLLTCLLASITISLGHRQWWECILATSKVISVSWVLLTLRFRASEDRCFEKEIRVYMEFRKMVRVTSFLNECKCNS